MTDEARDAAYHCLLDALTCALQSLQHAACTRLLGPVVPGATMTFGARVPGTSFQLDPAQAAFNLGTMIGWLNQQDAAFVTCRGHLADTLGAVLSVADYQARKALAEGRAPATVRDVLDALLGTALPVPNDDSQRATAARIDRCDSARIACAAAVASLLGATPAQIALARRLAAAESRVNGESVAPPPWWLGEANARGVRIALVAKSAPATDDDVAPAVQSPTGISAANAEVAAVSPIQTTHAPRLDESVAAGIRERFSAVVTAHFPPVQAEKIKAACLDRSRLEALPINELVSLTVRN
ncbi:MAG: MmgE/PrpD family protein [Gammaproteobacteria bacterium]|nr:MmgE/PrpD family protein [Gammaproteobacteria bacterium]